MEKIAGSNRRGFIKKTALASFLLGVTGSCSRPEKTYSDESTIPTDKDKLIDAPKLLLYSGWNTYNIGDQGHTPGTLRFFEKYFPEASVMVWLHKTNDETITMLKKRFPKIKIIRGNIDQNGAFDNSELQQIYEACDLFIHNSGMHYNSFWTPSPILDKCIENQKPFCLYGQSFDGFTEDIEADMVSKLSKAAAIYCRDVESYHYLRKKGVQSPILEFGPDGCFGIDLLNDNKAEMYMAEHKLESKKFLTVIIRTNTPGGLRPDKLPAWDIGDTTQNPRDPAEADIRQIKLWIDKMKDIVVQWVNITGLKVFLAPEVNKEIEMARKFVYDTLPPDIQSKVVLKSEWWNMDEASSMYKHSRTLVAMEPHSCIMALAHRTPIIHFFSKRHGLKAWMFRDIGLSEWLYNIDEEPTERLLKALMDIHENYDRALIKVDRAMTFVEQRSAEMVGDLKHILS
jgi:polysaccharide pyruvyl transferase WcaK-like protein